jgi:hypothetical protein
VHHTVRILFPFGKMRLESGRIDYKAIHRHSLLELPKVIADVPGTGGSTGRTVMNDLDAGKTSGAQAEHAGVYFIDGIPSGVPDETTDGRPTGRYLSTMRFTACFCRRGSSPFSTRRTGFTR